MLTIHKYNLRLGANKIGTYTGAKLLDMQVQGDGLVVWAVVDTRQVPAYRWVEVRGTGHEILREDLGEYVGTAQDGDLVWHLFDLGEREG